ncbi:MAG: (S)-ureidoglycine aminohydrolase [Rhodobacter sp.]|nr:(S)-ureidoglycine aminohydrolase [Rhodobacter sp.]
MSYAFPPGGLPDQSVNPEGTAIFTPAYAVLPAVTQRDIVTSLLPGWHDTRAWILARPLTGFAETFAQYAVEVAPGGGSDAPEPDPMAQAVLFVARGQMHLSVDGTAHELTDGGYAYLPPGVRWAVRNDSASALQFHWIRKRYQPLDGIAVPAVMITSDEEVSPTPMPNTDKWATTRFVDNSDIAYDHHVNIVTFQPGGLIPFAETHIMEHGLYVLQGTARYLLNKDWVEVGPGDFMWLRAFCPQACVATGDEPFRYLLYKDVNRHPSLELGR